MRPNCPKIASFSFFSCFFFFVFFLWALPPKDNPFIDIFFCYGRFLVISLLLLIVPVCSCLPRSLCFLYLFRHIFTFVADV